VLVKLQDSWHHLHHYENELLPNAPIFSYIFVDDQKTGLYSSFMFFRYLVIT